MLRHLKAWWRGDVARKQSASAPSASAQLADSSAQSLKTTGDRLFGEQQFAQAASLYAQSLALDPAQPEVYKNLGVIAYYRQDYDGAIAAYSQALAVKPDFPEALSNRGLAYHDLGQLDAALNDLTLALQFRPSFAAACNNRGLVYQKLDRWQEALADFDRAITLNPDYAQAYKNRGDVFKTLRDPANALRNYQRAMQLWPEIDLDFGLYLEQKSLLCDWQSYEQDIQQMASLVEQGVQVQPLTVLWQLKSAALKLKAAQDYVAYVSEKLVATAPMPPMQRLPRHDKIRIAYVCGEFFQHAIVFLMAELFEQHRKDKFEVYAFSLSAHEDDATERIKPAFDHFIQVAAHTDADIVALARSMEIDIAVDLNGITGNARPALFCHRLAPVQVSYLGYPGTSGMPNMDYILADEAVIPAAYQPFYSEKIVYLPCFQVNDRKRVVSDKVMTRAAFSLPDQGMVYCCLNNLAKITPPVFSLWMQILSQVDGSVLWLLGESELAIANLRKEAESRGVSADRLVFAGQLPYDQHLARYRLADLFLDTLPFNAGTTASDALWAGLPVLTQAGEAFSSRMGAGLLHAAGLSELVTETAEAYVALAIALGQHPERIGQLKQTLEGNRLSCALFDSAACTRHIESAYLQMYERYHAGLAPEHIYIASH